MQQGSSVLVTGAAGYLGSHACVYLLEQGFEVVGLDSFINSRPKVVERVYEVAGLTFPFHCIDLLDRSGLEEILRAYDFSAVMHFAGLKSVTESCVRPIDYYQHNVTGSLNLISAMDAVGLNRIVFSSTAAVYGSPRMNPVRECAEISPMSPYGHTKSTVESILATVCEVNPKWSACALRYFNPVGAHPSGLMGESPRGSPSNLIPYLMQVAQGQREKLYIYGMDYPTKDGTGVRDYIHVCDLIAGHVRAIDSSKNVGFEVYNLGTGVGYSVLDVVREFENIIGRQIPVEGRERRPGDVSECFADPSKAKRVLNWAAGSGLHEMCRDAWAWQTKNPHGYELD